MNPTFERDPYLRPVCRRWGEASALEAGWFDDGDPTSAPLDDVGWLCTPTTIVRGAVDALGPRPGKSPVVLLSTGGFFPVHDGHLAMMAAARATIEHEGRPVVGGYLSPAHDDYIAIKCGSVPVPVSTRLARAADVVGPTGWLAVDPWEALARRVSVNYTDVAARLETYLRHHIDPWIDVVYVCGGDNARFALAFAERGGCVVVGRPGTGAAVARWRTDRRVAGNDRVRWVDGDDTSSSSTIRGSQDPARRPVESTRSAKPHLVLRLEDEDVVATLDLDAARWRRFQDGIRAELAARMTVLVIAIEAQRAAAEDRATRRDEATAGTISADPMLPGDVDLAISRLFDLGGYHRLGHVARPGSAPLAQQLAAIPPGSWTLRDDDRATGSTVAAITARLPAGVTIAAATFALDVADDERAPHEIADSRDFLLGTDHGGLVVALPDGTIGRAPYLLPYVDPAVRAGLPGGDAIAFSVAAWRLNASVFAGTRLAVADLPQATARPLILAGHAPAAALDDVCRHHADVLAELQPAT